MYTSDTEHRRCLRAALGSLALALFCTLFAFVYERFSFGVWSFWMVFAAAIPLVLSVAPMLVLALRQRACPCRTAVRLWHSGMVCWTVGSIFQGVLEIYGTTNRLLLVYLAAGALLLLAGLSAALIDRSRRIKDSETGACLSF